MFILYLTNNLQADYCDYQLQVLWNLVSPDCYGGLTQILLPNNEP